MRHRGGAERYVEQIRRGLATAGDDVFLVTSTAGSAADGSADAVAYGTESLAAQSVLQIVNPWAWHRVRAVRRQFAPDVALVNMFANHLSPAVFDALAEVPVAYLATDFKAVCPTFAKTLPDGSTCRHREGRACLRAGCLSLPHWLREQPRYALIRRALRGAALVLACSDTVRRELARNGIRSELLALPIEPPGAGFTRAPAPEPLFVYLGRLAAQKGVLPLLEAFRAVIDSLPDARLRYVGDGPDRARLERAVEAAGLRARVELTGWLSSDSVESTLQDAWALVAPTRGPEPLGLVALEAIVRGVPVIATRNGGFAETVEDGKTGLLVADGDPGALAAALRAVATRSAFPHHRIEASRVEAIASQRSLSRHIGALREILGGLAARPAPARS